MPQTISMLVAYDISNSKKRRKTQKFLAGFSKSYQKSAFEVEVSKSDLKNIANYVQEHSEDADLVALFYFSDVIYIGKTQEVEFIV